MIVERISFQIDFLFRLRNVFMQFKSKLTFIFHVNLNSLNCTYPYVSTDIFVNPYSNSGSWICFHVTVGFQRFRPKHCNKNIKNENKKKKASTWNNGWWVGLGDPYYGVEVSLLTGWPMHTALYQNKLDILNNSHKKTNTNSLNKDSVKSASFCRLLWRTHKSMT